MLANIPSNFSLLLFLLLLLSIQSTFTLLCYECHNCTDIPSCHCTNVYETNRTDMHCILLRETLPNAVRIEIEHFPLSLPTYNISDPDYIYVEETISYNVTTKTWSTVSNSIGYGCATDLCNRDELLRELPSNGLSLMLPIDWLNEKLVRKEVGDLASCRRCDDGRICANGAYALNLTACPRRDCAGSCRIDEVYENADRIQLCYDSGCSDETTDDQPGTIPEIGISAYYYLKEKNFQIIEIAIVCNADRCDSLDLFKDITEKLEKNDNNIAPFLPIVNHANSIPCVSLLVLMMILFFQMIISY